jgi:transcription elongation factor GreA
VARVTDQMTPEGYEALKAELAELEGPARREIAERIKTAREWGDLKENSEYHDAKNDQAFLETRILRLAARLRNAEVVEATAPGGQASVGSEIEMRDEASGRVHTYRLVGAAEAKLSEGRLSVESPLGQAARGRRAGDQIVVRAPRGEMRYTVVAVR